MSDQAEHLRKLISEAASTRPVAEIVDAARTERNGCPIVAIGGGKRGVGVTTVAANLAAVFAARGDRVLLIDAALHSTDVAQAVGVPAAMIKHTLNDVLAETCRFDDTFVDAQSDLTIIANRVAKAQVDDSRDAQQRFLAGLKTAVSDYDIAVLDTGCGASPWSRRLWATSQLVVLVTTTDDQAVLETYSAIKPIVSHDHPSLRVLFNFSESDVRTNEARTRLTSSCRRFLRYELSTLPSLPRHVVPVNASESHWPRIWEDASSPFGHAAMWLGRAVEEAIATNPSAPPRAGIAQAHQPPAKPGDRTLQANATADVSRRRDHTTASFSGRR